MVAYFQCKRGFAGFTFLAQNGSNFGLVTRSRLHQETLALSHIQETKDTALVTSLQRGVDFVEWGCGALITPHLRRLPPPCSLPPKYTLYFVLIATREALPGPFQMNLTFKVRIYHVLLHYNRGLKLLYLGFNVVNPAALTRAKQSQ